MDFLSAVFKRVPSMMDFCGTLRTRYCMNDSSFTELDYLAAAETILFNCRDAERLRLNLPYQLVGRHCNAAIMILANTFKALAQRPEEDSAPLRVLVLENLPDIAVCHLGMNPIDLRNMMTVLGPLEHLVITLRRHGMDPQWSGLFGSCLWNMVGAAERLDSLCIVGMDHDDDDTHLDAGEEDEDEQGQDNDGDDGLANGFNGLPAPHYPGRRRRRRRGSSGAGRGRRSLLRRTRPWQLSPEDWRARTLPPPQVILSNLTCLELKRVEVLPAVLLAAAEHFGPSLRELYLNEVHLKVEQSALYNRSADRVLWVGLPNRRPPDDSHWMAMELRAAMPNLRVCRASFLAYDHYLATEMVDNMGVDNDNEQQQGHDDDDDHVPAAPATSRRPEFDLVDPCGLGRSISQRFVEVVMGVAQPSAPTGDPVEFLPADSAYDHRLMSDLRPRGAGATTAGSGSGVTAAPGGPGSRPRVVDYDVNAYQTAVDNTTSRWLVHGLDGVFANCNAGSLDRLHYIAETACQGMNEVHLRRRQMRPHANNGVGAAPPGEGEDTGEVGESD